MQLEVWNITGDGFHLGRHGLGQEESGDHVPSDSLAAALIARHGELFGTAATEAWVDSLRADPPALVISSAFPFAGEVRLFPAPMLRAGAAGAGGPRPKDLKRVRYVSEAIFRDLLRGGRLEAHFQTARKLHGGEVLVGEAEAAGLPAEAAAAGEIWKIEKRPRVTLGRAAQNSQIYFTGRTAFRPGCGLWFAVQWLDRTPERAGTLQTLLADLGEAGLGGERSNGFGRCAIKPGGTLELPDPGQGLWVTLSRYLPRPDEAHALADEAAAYSVQTVGGWIEARASKSERRRAVRLLAEGAVLGAVGRAAPGLVVDVAPNYGGPPLGHPVWRCGRALAVGLTPGAAHGSGA